MSKIFWEKFVYFTVYMLSVFLIILGLVLTLLPETGVWLFGITYFAEASTFVVVTGIRQLHEGVLMFVFSRMRLKRALGILLLTIWILPAVDFLLAWQAPGGSFVSALRHAWGIPLVIFQGVYLLKYSKPQ